jgi:hypothetical protein
LSVATAAGGEASPRLGPETLWKELCFNGRFPDARGAGPRVNFKHVLISALLGSPLVAAHEPAFAQETPGLVRRASAAQEPDSYSNQSIVVTGDRSRGSVLVDVPPIRRLETEDIRSYGAGTIAGLLEALEPETRGNRGTATQPVVLLNGARISGFAEISGLPTEAVERVEILPEEVALAYGYPATSRVVNVVLKPKFKAATAEIGSYFATAGGRDGQSADLSLVSIGRRRTTLDLSVRRDSPLLESERDIVQAPSLFALPGNIGAGSGLAGAEIDPLLSLVAGQPVFIAALPPSAATIPPTLQAFVPGANLPNVTDPGRYRTLLPSSRQFALNGAISGKPVGRLSATLSGRLTGSVNEHQLGLVPVTLRIGAGNPFNPFASDLLLYRVAGPASLQRRVEAYTQLISLLVGGDIGLWRWTASGRHERLQSRSNTGAGFESTAFQRRLDANDLSANPFGPLALTSNGDRTRYRSAASAIEFLANGSPFRLPAGDLLVSARARFDSLGFTSRRLAGGIDAGGRFDRQVGTFETSLDLPLAARRPGKSGGIGDLALSLNFVLRQLSDFGTLTTRVGSVRYSPSPAFNVSASLSVDEGAPDINELGEPLIVTPNVPNYDFQTGTTYNVSRLDGGNPALRRNSRREQKLEMTLRPFGRSDFVLSANYTRVQLRNPITVFPVATPEIEAALPGRFVRGADGRLVLVDNRPVTAAGSRFEGLRWGWDYVHRSSSRASDRIQLNLGAHHSWRFENTILIAPGIAELDLLNGSAAGLRGGQPRHAVDVQAGIFAHGAGARIDATWQSKTFVRGNTAMAGGGDLFFSALPRVNLRLFVNLGEQGRRAPSASWLRSARLSISVENLLDNHLRVRDAFGSTPLGYQPAYLDPVGRSIRLTFRTSLS